MWGGLIANWLKKGSDCLEGAGKCRMRFWKGRGRRCLVSLSSCCWRCLEITSALEEKRTEKKIPTSERARVSVYGAPPFFPFQRSSDNTVIVNIRVLNSVWIVHGASWLNSVLHVPNLSAALFSHMLVRSLGKERYRNSSICHTSPNRTLYN